jgi:hypothetical protein
VLRAPPSNFSSQPLTVIEVDPATLLRISKFSSGEPHFGTTAGNRFDDPRTSVRRRFGTHYAGLSLRVAFAETILHDENRRVAGSGSRALWSPRGMSPSSRGRRSGSPTSPASH